MQTVRRYLRTILPFLAAAGVCLFLLFFVANFGIVGQAGYLLLSSTSQRARPHLSDGRLAVYLDHVYRIQIYSAGNEFIGGWRVPDRVQDMSALPDGNLDIRTFTGRHLVTRPDGTIVSDTVHEKSVIPRPMATIHMPSPWWLWPLRSPLHAMSITLVSALAYHLLTTRAERLKEEQEATERKKRRQAQASLFQQRHPRAAIALSGVSRSGGFISSWIAGLLWISIGPIFLVASIATFIKVGFSAVAMVMMCIGGALSLLSVVLFRAALDDILKFLRIRKQPRN